MAEIFAWLLVSVLACFGMSRLLPPVGGCTAEWALGGLAGLVLLMLLAFVAGLFFPLAAVSPWIIGPAALAGLWRLRSCDRATLVVLLVLSVGAAAWASREVWHGDSGIYHVQAVLWMSESPLPAGLANLHRRFGFNSAWWSLAAVLPGAGSGGLHVASLPTALLSVLFGLLVWAAARAAVRRQAGSAQWLVLVSAYLWFRQMVGVNNPSLSTDAPCNLLVVASATALLVWAAGGSKAALATAWLLACGAATVKLNGYLWLATAVVAVGMMWRRVPRLEWSRRDAVIIGAGALLPATAAIRGYWSSGFPFYPLRLMGRPDLPWAAGVGQLAEETAGIREWPTRGDAAGWIEFVREWIGNQYGLTNAVFGVLLLVAMAVALAVLFRRGLPVSCRREWLLVWPLWLAAVVSCVAGFWYAPAFRFVSGFFFVAAGITVAVLLRGRWSSMESLSPRWMVAVLGAAAILPNIGQALGRPVGWARVPSLPPPAIEAMVTTQGETVQVGSGGFPWAAPRPASPDFNPSLLIKRDGEGKIRQFLPR